MTSSSAGISASFWQRAVPVSFRYRGHTGVSAHGTTAALRFAPNLAREPVFFDAEVREPLKMREAMAMLHAVVVGDHRFQKKDRSAWLAWKQRLASEDERVRTGAAAQARVDLVDAPPPRAGLDADFARARKRYWSLRNDLEKRLRREDPQLFRLLVPCDPVVTVAPDVVMFEGFSRDESSFGAVLVDREAFVGGHDATLGTTNVDYSLALAEQMDRLRSYRTTRLAFDPGGIDVDTAGVSTLREEKIDLPARWLKGFGQLSASLLLPARRVRLPVRTLYAVLAHLKTHREKSGPRALRFLLEPGKPPVIVVDPWGLRIESDGPAYAGDAAESIGVWGRRRLMSLARALPMAQLAGGFVDVSLLGHGMPSIWSVDLGGVRAVLALSGYTANDWSGGARLDLLASSGVVDDALTQRIATYLQATRTATLSSIALEVKAAPEAVRASVVRLSQLGQVVADVSADVTMQRVRFRQVIDAPLSAELLGDEPVEITRGRELVRTRQIVITKQDHVGGKRFVAASCGGIACEALLDADGAMTRARCGCSFFHRAGLKKGPCRHLLALRLYATTAIQ